MSTPTIDYDALARKHGGQLSNDQLDALAKKYGANSQPSSAPEPQPSKEGFIDWATRNGGDFLGDLWDSAKGLYHTVSDAPKSSGEYAASMLGPTGVPLKRIVEGYMSSVQAANEAAKSAAEKGNTSESMIESAAAGLPLVGPLVHGVYGKSPGLAASRIVQAASMAPKGSIIPNPVDVAGNVTSAVGGKLAPAAEAVSQRLYQSALKPSLAKGAPEPAGLVKTGLQENIPISQAGAEKLASLVDDLNKKVEATIASNPNAPISPAKSVQNANALKKEFSQQVNPAPDIAAIEDTKQGFLDQLKSSPGGAVRNLTADEAQAMKKGTYKQLRGKYGELKSAQVEAEKALARGLKEELENQFPEIKGLNASEGKALNLQEALEKAIRRNANTEPLGVATPLAAGGVGTAVGFLSGSGEAGGAAALGYGIVRAIMKDPELRSKIALGINHASKGRIPLPTAQARIAAYANALSLQNTSESGQKEPQ